MSDLFILTKCIKIFTNIRNIIENYKCNILISRIYILISIFSRI